MFSERSEHDASPNALTSALRARRARGERVIDLTDSNPTTLGFAVAPSTLSALATEASTIYEPSPLGLRAAREVIAKHLAELGPSIDPDRIVLTASTSEAYGYLLHALCDPDDEILVAAPSYPLVTELAALSGVEVTSVPLRFDGAWALDLEALFEAVTERTRAIFLASPNHPTGHLLDEETALALAELDLPVVVDEVFTRFVRRPRVGALQTIRALPELFTITLEGLSKSAALPQLKLAWMALSGPDDRVDPLLTRLERIADAYLSVSTPVQHALPSLLEASAGAREAIGLRVEENLEALKSALEGSAADVMPVEGGWFACVRVPETRSDEAWALALLERGVLASPGYLFDFPDGAWLVISLIVPVAELREAATVLRTLLDAT